MKPAWRVVILASTVLLFAVSSVVVCRAQEVSHARIVRLSFVEGSVAIQRPDLEDWALAPVNTPIQEGFRLATDQNGFAEVEFENSSTARLGQLSMIEFTQLALLPSGGKLNRLTLHQGYATFNVAPEGEDFYEVKAGAATLTPRNKSRFRVDLEEGVMQLKVFQGVVEFVSAEGNGTIGHNTVLQLEFGAGHPLQLTQGITKDAWDEWVEERENRLQVAQSSVGPARPSGVGDFFFGLVDLAFYGNWFSDADYGHVWVPTVDAGWNPYAAGRWVWYPGFGFVWISDHPWGWVPYHYGGWVYRPGIGWFWVPGDFQAWSPAGVNWFRGPGWIGWHPRSPLPGGRQPHCPDQGCVVAVADQHFRDGNPVGPNRQFNSTGGVPVDRPGFEPGRLCKLPGAPLAASGARAASPVGKPVAPPAAPIVGRSNPPASVTAGARPPLPFQPRLGEPRGTPSAGRQGLPSSPARTVATAPASGARSSAPVAVARPGPANNYPASTAAASQRGTSASDQTVQERGGERPGLFGSRTGEHDSRSAAKSSGTASRSAASSSTPARSGASVGSRSSGGSASGSRASSSSGSARSGGSSSGASSRSSGGSSGGSHSSGSGGSHSSSSASSRGSGGGGSSGGGHSSSSGTKR